MLYNVTNVLNKIIGIIINIYFPLKMYYWVLMHSTASNG